MTATRIPTKKGANNGFYGRSIQWRPHSVKSKIPIWKCVWCQKRRGKPTDTEIALLNAWLKEYGYTLEPLAFCDDGGIRYAYEVFGRGRGPVARLDGG
jgi:hypothetical protein